MARPGRPKGSKDKLTKLAEEASGESPKVIFDMAFEALGGLKGLVEWGKSKPDKFYTLYSRIAPSSRAGEPVHRGGNPRENVAGPSTVIIKDFTDE